MKSDNFDEIIETLEPPDHFENDTQDEDYVP